jgi:hypothetical protein
MVMATLFREAFGGSRTIRPILQAFAGSRHAWRFAACDQGECS